MMCADQFCFKGRSVGLTYSRADLYGIESKEEITGQLIRLMGLGNFITGQEFLAVDPDDPSKGLDLTKWHFHMYYCADATTDTSDRHFWDYKGCHPTIIVKPKSEWKQHCKRGDYITNNPTLNDNVQEAQKLPCHEEAMSYLWDREPEHMALNAHNIERSLIKRRRVARNGTSYYGPHLPVYWLFPDWNPRAQSLFVYGPSGTGKTEFFRYWMAHAGGFFNISGALDSIKSYDGSPNILLDNVKFNARGRWQLKDWQALFLVEEQGSVLPRYCPGHFPPVPKVFLSTRSLEELGVPNHHSIRRNIYTYEWKEFPKPITIQEID